MWIIDTLLMFGCMAFVCWITSIILVKVCEAVVDQFILK